MDLTNVTYVALETDRLQKVASRWRNTSACPNRLCQSNEEKIVSKLERLKYETGS